MLRARRDKNDISKRASALNINLSVEGPSSMCMRYRFKVEINSDLYSQLIAACPTSDWTAQVKLETYFNQHPRNRVFGKLISGWSSRDVKQAGVASAC